MDMCAVDEPESFFLDYMLQDKCIGCQVYDFRIFSGNSRVHVRVSAEAMLGTIFFK